MTFAQIHEHYVYNCAHFAVLFGENNSIRERGKEKLYAYKRNICMWYMHRAERERMETEDF